jgi:hypothetical protein
MTTVDRLIQRPRNPSKRNIGYPCSESGRPSVCSTSEVASQTFFELGLSGANAPRLDMP